MRIGGDGALGWVCGEWLRCAGGRASRVAVKARQTLSSVVEDSAAALHLLASCNSPRSGLVTGVSLMMLHF